MKTMCSPGYHHNGFVATHALGHMMYIIYSILYIYWQKYKLVHYIEYIIKYKVYIVYYICIYVFFFATKQ